MKKYLFAFCLLCSFNLEKANAAYFMEPYLGHIFHSSGKFAPFKLRSMAPLVGMRTGGSYKGFHTGSDFFYQYGRFTAQESFKANIESDDNDGHHNRYAENPFSSFGAGVFAGFEFPFLWRLFVKYHFYSVSKVKAGCNLTALDCGNKNIMLKGARDFSVAIGYTGLNDMTINMNYRIVKYSKYTSGGKEKELGSKFALKELLLTISFPMVFGI